MQTAQKIIIVGGGIGGAATAFALDRAGFDVTVYERTSELREVGAGIALWANATHILKNFGLLEDAIRVGNPITNYQFNSQTGKELVNINVDGFDLPVLGIHRGQGACMALEDALVITKCLQAQSDPTSAFQQYESQRFARTKSIVEQSLRSGKMGELENRHAVALRNIFMKLMGAAINNSFHSIHAYRA